MRVTESVNVPDKMWTARRYKCFECWQKLYTVELPWDDDNVRNIMNNNKWSLARKDKNEDI